MEKYLEFSLGTENYAIPLLRVKEVIPVPQTTVVPNSPNYFKGIMNLRGLIISIIDLRAKLGINTKKNEHVEEAVIIVDVDGYNIGLIVDSINHVLSFSLDKVSEIPEVKSQNNAQYIMGVYRSENSLTVLLDLKGILSFTELSKITKRAA
ncbi:MAG: chemotaxis protein CheW [Bacteriovoracaceae bacterium]